MYRALLCSSGTPCSIGRHGHRRSCSCPQSCPCLHCSSPKTAFAPLSVGRRAVDFWDKLDTKQRIYTVVAGGALVLSLPQIVGVLLIPLERLLVRLRAPPCPGTSGVCQGARTAGDCCDAA